MSDDVQVKKIKCPHCGWIRSVPVNLIEEVRTTTVVRGWSDELKKLGTRLKDMAMDTELDEANAWVDMPKCSHCGNVYRYNVRTEQVTR